MPTIAIVGAGPQLGAAIARRFGIEGFNIALIARNSDRLTSLADSLRIDGFSVAAYTADVRNTGKLADALDSASKEFNGIDVLEYSPLPADDYLQPILSTTREQAQAAFEFSVLGPMTAVASVLPGMRNRGYGSLLFTSGGSSLVPNSKVGGTSIAMAGEAAYLTMLHETLTPEGINVSHLVVPVRIGPGEPLGNPDKLADQVWQLHKTPEFRVVVGQ